MRIVCALVFALAAMLLGAVTVHAITMLDSFATRARAATNHAVALTASAQRLDERGTAMQRSARQFAVLADAGSHKRYLEAARDAQLALAVLEPALPSWQAAHAQAWRHAAANVSALMAPSHGLKPSEALALDRALAPLPALQAQIGEDIQLDNTRQQLALLDEVGHARYWLVAELGTALLLSAAMALALVRHLPARQPSSRSKEESDLGDLVRSAIAERSEQIDAAGMRVAMTGHASPIALDPDGIHEAIGGLIDHAIDAGHPGATVWLGLSERDGCATLDCIDAGGQGIDRSLPEDSVARVRAQGGRLESLPTLRGAHLRMSLPYAS